MKGYLTFTGKEFSEGILSYRTIIFFAVLLLFGITNPLIAKLTPELLNSLAGEGITVSIAEPAALDSWVQFFKNTSQLGLIVGIILASGTLSRELSRGTLIPLLTKGLSRTSVVLAKFTAMALVWTACYGISLLATLGYTAYLFPDSTVENLPFALLALWLFGICVFAALMFAASVTKTSYACLLVTGLIAAALLVLGIVPAAHDFNPASLATESTALLMGATDPASLMPAVVIAAVATVAFVVCAVLSFRKRQL